MTFRKFNSIESFIGKINLKRHVDLAKLSEGEENKNSNCKRILPHYKQPGFIYIPPPPSFFLFSFYSTLSFKSFRARPSLTHTSGREDAVGSTCWRTPCCFWCQGSCAWSLSTSDSPDQETWRMGHSRSNGQDIIHAMYGAQGQGSALL